MTVKVVLNRASLRVDRQLKRQINGSTVRTDRLINAFRRSDVPFRMAGHMREALKALHAKLMYMFSGGVTGIGNPVASALGVAYREPWQPLSAEYAVKKKYEAYWRESGELLNYASSALASLDGPQAVTVEVRRGKIKRGAEKVRASVLLTPARLPEPFQSLVMYPFLQGRSNDLSEFGDGGDPQSIKLLVNHALRGFIPEISADQGRQLINEIRR